MFIPEYRRNRLQSFRGVRLLSSLHAPAQFPLRGPEVVCRQRSRLSEARWKIFQLLKPYTQVQDVSTQHSKDLVTTRPLQSHLLCSPDAGALLQWPVKLLLLEGRRWLYWTCPLGQMPVWLLQEEPDTQTSAGQRATSADELKFEALLEGSPRQTNVLRPRSQGYNSLKAW